ncbi:helix-turn-helix domain-containing protein [Curtobacterium flaccumfaciens]|uniref:helix-turn-helix domain-containing protein n=1 Tax=Curtobacterium TaxID=2034 RepID=UPI001BE047F0|nr:helix-turn-helix domain-containing protein [Curtobacterium flaccumfaciens pv. poinsettiae]
MPDPARGRPADRAPAPWPEVASVDPLAEVARTFVLRLRRAMGDLSVRAVASEAGISHVTLLRVLNGQVWPDLVTITRLEIALDADLHSSRAVRKAPPSADL